MLKKNKLLNRVGFELIKLLDIVFWRSIRYYAEECGIERKTKFFYSSPKSFNDDQVTILAIIETIILIFISLMLVIDGIFIHIKVGVLLAPLLLLRTDESVQLGLLTLDKLTKKLRDFFLEVDIHFYFSERSIKFISPLALSLFPLIVLTARCYSITVQFVLTPLKCIKSIPRNWKKQVFCIDSAHPPEPVPSIESIHYQGEWSDLKFSNIDFYQKISNLHFTYTVFLIFLVSDVTQP